MPRICTLTVAKPRSGAITLPTTVAVSGSKGSAVGALPSSASIKL